jgi:hypothetical protein
MMMVPNERFAMTDASEYRDFAERRHSERCDRIPAADGGGRRIAELGR